jgi:protein CpxP
MNTGLKTLSRSLVVAGLLAGSALATFAQTTPAAPKPHAAASAPMKHGDMHGGMHGRMDPAKMEAMIAKHLADLKTKLKITAAQEGSWTAFTAAMKPPARPQMSHPDRAEMDKLTTPERIDKMRALRAQHQADRQANMDKREAAVKAFYADLNAEQKKTFDAEHSKMMHRWGDRKGHGARHEAPGTPAKS